ncbi:SpaH/EbpB family LPXTG-anchored major pilin [Corynebacterium hindlerae]|uniref:SpaH/EbpB family LPXTG-anchored major pilin n=1 Tax=Corynebacterium hindlerae TaxID=699041 RepID=UPI003AAA5CCE
MSTYTWGKRALSTVCALLIATILALGSSMVALAAPVIDKDTGTLHITKLSTPTAAPTTPTGNKVELPTGAKGIPGVSFSVQKIKNIDLKTNAGWFALEGTDIESPGELEENKATQPTNSEGVITLEGLPVGAYLVKETATPVGVTPAAPFIVTVPITNPTDTGAWLYDVWVYPKNSQIDANDKNPQEPKDPNGEPPFDPGTTNPDDPVNPGPVPADPADPNLPHPDLPKLLKQIYDATPYANGGQQVTYTIWAPLPRPVQNTGEGTWATPDGFKVEDSLPQSVTATDVKAALVYREDLGGASKVHELSVDDADITTGGTVAVTVKEAGLNKIKAAAHDEKARIKVTIKATVSGEIAEMTQLRNFARVYPDKAAIEAGEQGNRWLATSLVDTYWGGFSFDKQNKSGEPLKDAEFNLALSKEDAKKGTFIRNQPAKSGEGGKVAFTGLRASDWQNGKPIKDSKNYQVYWLTETKAPKDYVLLAEPIPVVLLKDGTVKQVQVGDDGSVTVGDDTFSSVINVKTNGGFTLPLTGGAGTWMLTLGGIALLLFVLFAARRRNREAEEA